MDLEIASLKERGNVGWIAAYATVTKTIGTKNYGTFLKFTQEFIRDSKMSPKLILEYILRGVTNTVFELSQGENFRTPEN